MGRIRGLTLDAFGTILELLPPAGPLVEELRSGWGVELTEDEIWPAFAAEMTFYKAHHLDGADPDSLADLRRRSAAVLLENLPETVRERVDLDDFVPAMMRTLRFRPFPEVVPALERLREGGVTFAVVSNWDVSLHEFIADSELGPLIEHVVSSAEVGVAKPDPAPFRRGLEMLGLEPNVVAHVGDDPDKDVLGAAATDIAPILIRRHGGSDPAPGGAPVIRSFRDLLLML